MTSAQDTAAVDARPDRPTGSLAAAAPYAAATACVAALAFTAARPTTPASTWLIAAVAAACIAAPAAVRTLREWPPATSTLLCTYVATAAAAWMFGVQRSEAPWAAMIYALAALLVLLAATSVRAKHAPAAIAAGFTLVFSATTLAALTEWTVPSVHPAGNLWRAVPWHNQSAVFTGMFCCVAVAATLTLRRWWQLPAAFAAVAAATTALSGSRAGIATVVAGVAVTVIASRPTLAAAARLAAPAVGAVVVAAALLFVQGPSLDPASAGSLGPAEVASTGVARDASVQQNGQARLNIWADAAEMFTDRPLTGVGLGGFPAKFYEYRDPSTNRAASVHNQYLEAFAEGGVLFGVAFAALSVLAALAVARRVLRGVPSAAPHLWRALAAGGAGGAAVIIAHQGLDTDWTSPPVVALGAVCVGLAVSRPPGGSSDAPPDQRTPRALAVAAVAALTLFAVTGTAVRTTHLVAVRGPVDSPAAVASATAPWASEVALVRAGQLVGSGDLTEAAAVIDRALAWNPGDRRLAARAVSIEYLSGTASVDELVATLPTPDEGAWFDQYRWTIAALAANGEHDAALEVNDAALERSAIDEFFAEPKELLVLWSWRVATVGELDGCGAAQAAADDAVTALAKVKVRSDAPLELADDICRRDTAE